MQRHKRTERLEPRQVEKYKTEAELFHRQLMEMCLMLKTGSEQYRAIMNLGDHIVDVWKHLTGDDPDWLVSKKGFMSWDE